MTTPPDGLLFDVATPPTPVERLLLLADQYVQHNDMLDRLLRSGPQAEPGTNVASGQRLAYATRTAIKAILDERLFESHELSDTVVRLQQLAFLSGASTEHPLPTARMLTAWLLKPPWAAPTGSLVRSDAGAGIPPTLQSTR
ncbi:hypothetical protein AB0D13_09855 [Streptomyces sp. NPDC048430]|uniref:hypothetical protein n=1 Tax=Streptomyces sp. NPDC048430 TaxID=3155388 RepID=UPI00342C1886